MAPPLNGSVSGDPKKLASGGDDFRDAANLYARILENESFYYGGEEEKAAVGTAADCWDDHGVGDFLVKLCKSMYSHVLSGELQLRDAALDLWDVSKAFATADKEESYWRGEIKSGDLVVISNDHGIKTYAHPWDKGTPVVEVDKEGKVLVIGQGGTNDPKFSNHEINTINRPKPADPMK